MTNEATLWEGERLFRTTQVDMVCNNMFHRYFHSLFGLQPILEPLGLMVALVATLELLFRIEFLAYTMFQLKSDERWGWWGQGRSGKILHDNHVFHATARSMNYWSPKKLTVVTCPRWGKSQWEVVTKNEALVQKESCYTILDSHHLACQWTPTKAY